MITLIKAQILMVSAFVSCSSPWWIISTIMMLSWLLVLAPSSHCLLSAGRQQTLPAKRSQLTFILGSVISHNQLSNSLNSPTLWREVERCGERWKDVERGGESISIWKTSLTLAWSAGAGGSGHLKCKYRTTTTYLTPHTSHLTNWQGHRWRQSGSSDGRSCGECWVTHLTQPDTATC